MSQKSTNDIVGDNFYKELIQFQTDFTQNDHDSYVNVPETTRSDQAAETNSETSQQGILRDRKATTRLAASRRKPASIRTMPWYVCTGTETSHRNCWA